MTMIINELPIAVVNSLHAIWIANQGTHDHTEVITIYRYTKSLDETLRLVHLGYHPHDQPLNYL